MGRIKVGVFDENYFFRIGIAHVLKTDPEIEVVAEGDSALEALRLSRALSPHVIVLDYKFLEAGLKLAQIITAIPFVNFLILSFSMDTKQAFETFAAGARGYVFKGVSGQELREAIRAVSRGEGYMSPALAAEMMMNQAALEKSGKRNPTARLSHREQQIFGLLCAGLQNREIGARLNVAERTVKHYITRIFGLLNVRNRVEAVALASHSNPLIDDRKAFRTNSISNGENAHLESFSGNLTPSEKTAAALCFETVFGSAPTNRQSEFLGTHVFFSDSTPRRRR